MNTLNHIEKLLHQRMGMDFSTVGSSVVTFAIQTRMRLLRIDSVEEYYDYLMLDTYEPDLLTNEVVVPETWFFRDYSPFENLEQRVQQVLREHPHRKLRILSLPCATGEEPYSIAMTMLSVEPDTSRWQIDAFDINSTAIRTAKKGLYHAHSFREKKTQYCIQRFFTPQGDQYKISEDIINTVSFVRGNLIDPDFDLKQDYYDIIFFRNLLIYFNNEDKNKALERINTALKYDGVLIVGHAEAACVPEALFEVCGTSDSFTFSRRQRSKEQHKTSGSDKQVPGSSHRHGRKRQSRSTPSLCSSIRLLANPASPPVAPKPPVTARRRWQEQQDADNEQSESATPALPDLEQAFTLADRGEYDMALHICISTLKVEPANDRCHYLLGLLYEARGDRAQGESYLRKAIYLNPDYVEAMIHLALLLEKSGQSKQAAQLRERAERKREAADNKDDIDKAI